MLALETATSTTGVALVKEEQLIAEAVLNTGLHHTQQLLPLVRSVLAQAGVALAQVEALAVSLGPGSFTGLRIGLATVQGLALVHNCPVVAVPTLDILAENAVGLHGLICTIIRARKDEVYTALYRSEDGTVQRISDYLAIPPRDLPRFLPDNAAQVWCLGDGVQAFNSEWLGLLAERYNPAPNWQHLVRPWHLGRLGWRFMQQGSTTPLEQLRPMYLRASAAEEALRQRSSMKGEVDERMR